MRLSSTGVIVILALSFGTVCTAGSGAFLPEHSIDGRLPSIGCGQEEGSLSVTWALL